MDISFDTCTGKISLTIGEEKTLKTYISGEKKQNIYLIKIFKSALKDFNIKLEDIKNYYFTVGPGSFTGIRSGISFLYGLTDKREVKLYPISTLEAIALSREGVSIVLLKQSEKYFYIAKYKVDKKITEILKPKIITKEEVENLKDENIIKLEDLKKPLSEIIFEKRKIIKEKKFPIKPVYVRNPYEI